MTGPKKMFAYRVTESSVPEVPVGVFLLYSSGKGPRHAETVFDTEAKTMLTYRMEKIGACWAVGKKIQFEKPPLKSGELTKRMLGGETS